jgi:hypothetical protein
LKGADSLDAIQNELDELKAEKNAQLTRSLVTYKDLFTKPYLRRPLAVAAALQIAQVRFITCFSCF